MGRALEGSEDFVGVEVPCKSAGYVVGTVTPVEASKFLAEHLPLIGVYAGRPKESFCGLIDAMRCFLPGLVAGDLDILTATGVLEDDSGRNSGSSEDDDLPRGPQKQRHVGDACAGASDKRGRGRLPASQQRKLGSAVVEFVSRFLSNAASLRQRAANGEW